MASPAANMQPQTLMLRCTADPPPVFEASSFIIFEEDFNSHVEQRSRSLFLFRILALFSHGL